MAKTISATDAKNNFGGLLEDVAALDRVDIIRHGRLVAVVLSPRAFGASYPSTVTRAEEGKGGSTHMVPPALARSARMLASASTFDEE